MVKLKKKQATKPTKKQTKTIKKPKKSEKNGIDYAKMSVDSFFEQDFENSDIEEENEPETSKQIDETPQSHSEPEDSADELPSDDEEVPQNESKQHKLDLEKLKQTDPEFYKFLQENDKKLLQFDLSDDEEEEDEDADEELQHKPPQQLEVASDESDFEDDEGPKTEKLKDHGKVTLKMLKSWEQSIQTDKSNKTITIVCQAFHAAMLTVMNNEEDNENKSGGRFIVEGAAVFNGIIQLSVLQLGPALRRFLGIAEGSKQPPHKCKKFNKVKGILKDYFGDLVKLLRGVTSANIQTVLLKHLHYISPFLVSYPNICKLILKRLISIWGTAEESVRVIAFFCILRITNQNRQKFLDNVLKTMYMTYVKNSKFVSVSSLANLNFMRRSLVEMFALDLNVSYQHVFLYIRQLAIHLRNAITINKKENIQAVYNWQYINSLKLWGNLLGATINRPQLQQLIYPLVQVCLGVLRLVPTAQYYPLRFHVIGILNDLSRESNVFIPILPFVLEVLNGYDFNKKHQKVSMKPIQFTCLLRASKSQLVENGYKDAIIEAIYGSLLEYLAAQSSSVAFPDLSLVCTLQIRQFLKKCQNANFNRKMKQLLEKIEQNSQFVENERSKISLTITDFKQIDGWESQLKAKNTPLSTFFENWHKLHTVKKNKQLTRNDELAEYNLPKITKKATTKRKSEDGPVELFPSDSEDEEMESEDVEKPKRGKRGGKNRKNKTIEDQSGPVDVGNEEDHVTNLELSDW